MELILSHRNIDFDGLAAMVAAKRIWPQAKIVLSGAPGPAVAKFLALYRDSLPIFYAHQIKQQQLRRVVIVDTNSQERLGDMDWAVDHCQDITIFDHHPPQNVISAQRVVLEPVGAATTLLVEELSLLGREISPFEATIFALGIYQDTGALIHPGTSSRDATAVALLLERGANLSVVEQFMEQPLDDVQQALLNKLLGAAQEVRVNGILLLICRGETEEYVGGLAFLSSKLLEVTGVNSLISIVKMGKRVHLVGRTRLDCVPMNSIMAEFGGGGHPKAAAATVKHGELGDIHSHLMELLKQKVQPLVTAEKIMSYPVKAVSPDTSINEAGKLMLRYGHGGMPVQQAEQLVGMVSRRDVDKAMHHGLGHAPVKGFMNGEVHIINKHAPLPEIQRLMVRHNVGRLPVVDDGRVVGIVSRSDVLVALHGDGYDHPFNTLYLDQCNWRALPNIPALLASELDKEQLALLAGIGVLADENNWGAYLVGGCVRDLLLGARNLDTDIVVVGNAAELAKKLVHRYGGRLRVHEKFQTATVMLPGDVKIDLATARKEYYQYPAALPAVEQSNLREDLYRRDFTVNAMAIALQPDKFGDLVDYFCCYSDLEEKKLRVMHNLSFVEDPTRILRAVRFQQRYHFGLEPQTAFVMTNAIQEEMLKNISPDRIWSELKLIFAEPQPQESLKQLAQLGVLPQIIPDLEWKQSLAKGIHRADRVIAKVHDATNIAVEPWLLYLSLLLIAAPQQQALAWLAALSLAKEQRQLLERCLTNNLARKISTMPTLTPGKLHKLLHTYSPLETAVGLCRVDNEEVAATVYQYLKKRAVLPERLFANGETLRQLGVKPGPIYKRALFAMEQAVLDGEITSDADQRQFLRRWLETKGVL